MKKFLAAFGALLLCSFNIQPTYAQSNTTSWAVPVASCAAQTLSVGTPAPLTQTSTGSLCTNTTASIGGFISSASGSRMTPITVGTSDSSGTLPTGSVVVVTNAGATLMYCNARGVAATASDQPIAASGGWFAFTISGGITTLHCISTGSGTTANGLGGDGIPTGTGGGGGGSGGAVTIADGADVTLGAKADSVCGTATGTCSDTALLKYLNSQLAAMPNTGGCGSLIPISQTASTDLHTSVGKSYICSIILVAPDAEVVSLVEGTGSVCATGIAAVIGATTAANGMSFAANGGFSAVSSAPMFNTQTTNDHLCLLQSGSGRIAGFISYNDH